MPEQIRNGVRSLRGLCALFWCPRRSLCNSVAGYRGIISAFRTIRLNGHSSSYNVLCDGGGSDVLFQRPQTADLFTKEGGGAECFVGTVSKCY
jgi:hypothetical protein